jgi:hypothetical protein
MYMFWICAARSSKPRRDFLCLDFVFEIVGIETVEAAFLGFSLRIH